MLKWTTLKREIQEAFELLLPNAMEQAMLTTYPIKTAQGDIDAKRFADVFTNVIADPLSTALASAIDYHVRSADVWGIVITMGSAVTQNATIESPDPLTNGTIPNTFGIK